jgi:hypothetical protein
VEFETLPDISYSGPLLDVPDPPPDLPYVAYEDYRARVILEQNGIAVDEASLVRALESQANLLQAFAAHAAGAIGARSAISILNNLLSSPDDTAQVESGFALVRLGEDSGRDVLVAALEWPSNAYLSTLTAAGYLAQSGDPRGLPQIAAALNSDLGASRMLACKQLLFFWPYHCQPPDVLALFTRALADVDTNVQWQALVQMRQIASPTFAESLDAYLKVVRDAGLRVVAGEILESLRRL